MNKESFLDAETLRTLLDYNPETGEFIRKSTKNTYLLGRAAGSVHSHGYRIVYVNGRNYPAHRLAWLYVYGRWPEKQLDHIDGNRDNNSIANLREATAQQNTHNRRRASRNSRHGLLGVSRARNGRWTSEIRVNYERKHLGTFDTAEQAHAAYVNAKRELHPFSTLNTEGV